mgnify:CR=1 FL=1
MSDKNSDLITFICAMYEVDKLGWLFKNRFSGSDNMLVNRFTNAGNDLATRLEKRMDDEEQLTAVSEAFGIIFNIARKQDKKKFIELVALIKEWDNGTIIIKDDEQISP